MKVTTEKLPKSLLALEIELDREQVEKGLDRAARRLSQKYTVPGFRKGKAPRFIIENYFGREALLEEASEDLINKAFREALEQENVTPVGQASLEGIKSADPFRFRVTVPVPPTVALPDYRAIRVPLNVEPVMDETVERAMEMLRDKHVVLKELEEPRPAQQGDQLTVKLESLVDGEPLEQRGEDGAIPDTTLVLADDRLVPELYEGLLGSNTGDEREIVATMAEDHANERVRGKQVTFRVAVQGIQERLLPEWDELPVLENFAGSVDQLREKTRRDLEDAARGVAERELLDTYIGQLVEQAEFDIPDVAVREEAESMLHEQGQQFERYGITLEQMLQYRGKTRDEAIEELLPKAERRLKTTLALQQVVQGEQLGVSNAEIEVEVKRLLLDYQEEERPNVANLLTTQLRRNVANMVLDRKLRARMVAIATGEAPPIDGDAAPGEATYADDSSPSPIEPTAGQDDPAVRAEDETASPAQP